MNNKTFIIIREHIITLLLGLLIMGLIIFVWILLIIIMFFSFPFIILWWCFNNKSFRETVINYLHSFDDEITHFLLFGRLHEFLDRREDRINEINREEIK